MDMSIFILVLIAAMGLFAIYLITTYNRMQSLKNGASATLSQIRVAMKKRLDMVEQLVELAKGYAHFEQETMERIAGMRSGLTAASPPDIKKIDSGSKSLLAEIRATAESYPALKTSDAVLKTMNAVSEMEDEISRHRYTYNNIIQELNTMTDTLPSSFIANMARIDKQEYLSFEEDELSHAGYLTAEQIEPRRPEAKWD